MGTVPGNVFHARFVHAVVNLVGYSCTLCVKPGVAGVATSCPLIAGHRFLAVSTRESDRSRVRVCVIRQCKQENADIEPSELPGCDPYLSCL